MVEFTISGVIIFVGLLIALITGLTLDGSSMIGGVVGGSVLALVGIVMAYTVYRNSRGAFQFTKTTYQ